MMKSPWTTDYINDVQVIGMYKSGTNFVEWSLNNNFEDIDYRDISRRMRRTRICPVTRESLPEPKIGEWGQLIAIKHLFPGLDITWNNTIAIYREFDVWANSMKEYTEKDDTVFNIPLQEGWDNWWKGINEQLDPERTIVVEHSWAVKNYSDFMNLIVDKFGYTLKKDFRAPSFRLDKGGAQAVETEEPFSL